MDDNRMREIVERGTPILLVRLKPRLPNGAVVPESRRVCHLVALPEANTKPEALRAYCGLKILPGSADLLDGVAGMPCEPCLAAFRVPWAMDCVIPPGQGANRAGWSDRSLVPQLRLDARFVLLILLQDPTRRPLSVAQIAERLGLEPDRVNLVLLLLAVIGWVERWWTTPKAADRAWTDCRCRLAEQAVSFARRLLAEDLTPTFTALAGRLDLDITVIFTQTPAPNPGGRNGAAPAAPTGHQHGPSDEEGEGS